MNATVRALSLPLIIASLVVSSCGSGGDSSSNTTAASSAETVPAAVDLSLDVSDEWEALATCTAGPQTPADSDVIAATTPAGEGVDGVLAFDDVEPSHVEDCVDYPVRPTVGGAHFPVWANCGFYTSPVPEESAAHVLEHGGVWIAFDPAIDTAQLTAIRSVTASATHILASPYPGLNSPIVLSAWGRQLDLDSVDDDRFEQFIDTYLEGPQTLEPGAPCTGGMGTPG